MKKILLSLTLLLVTATVFSQSSYSLCYGQSVTISGSNLKGFTNPVFILSPGNVSNTTGTFAVSPSSTTIYYITTKGSSPNLPPHDSIEFHTSQVDVFSQPTLNPVSHPGTCAAPTSSINLNLGFNGNSPTPAYSLFWSPIPNNITSNTQHTASNVAPGVYNVTVTGAGGCKASASFSVATAIVPASIHVLTGAFSPSITCKQAVLNYTGASAGSYTWNNGSSPVLNGQSVSIPAPGSWTISHVNNSGCQASKVITIGINTITPVSTLSPLQQSIACSPLAANTVSLYALSPTVNINQKVFGANGVFTANGATLHYTPASPGTYTSVITNDLNGCSTTKTFVVNGITNPIATIASPQNFSLGCSSKSICTIAVGGVTTQPMPGSPVSYTFIPPGGSTVLPNGPLSSISSITVNIPGNWMVVIKDNLSLCESRIPVSVVDNKSVPFIDSIYAKQILDCYTPSTILKASASNSNTSSAWKYGLNTIAGNTLLVQTNTAIPTATFIGHYTFVVTDNNSLCQSSTIIPIFQNLFKPNVQIIASPSVITCQNTSVTLVNQSSTGIPPNSFFPVTQPVIGWLWEGPMPQTPLQLSSTYIAQTAGVYTLTGLDLNNGCTNTKTLSVADNRFYPIINIPGAVNILCPHQTALLTPTVINTPGGGYSFAWSAPLGTTITPTPQNGISVSSPGLYTLVVTNTITGCASTVIYTVTVCAGLNGKNTADEIIQVYPNPSSGKSTLKFTSSERSSAGLYIVDVTGRLIISDKININTGLNTFDLDLEKVTRGYYFIVIDSGTSRKHIKFMRE